MDEEPTTPNFQWKTKWQPLKICISQGVEDREMGLKNGPQMAKNRKFEVIFSFLRHLSHFWAISPHFGLWPVLFFANFFPFSAFGLILFPGELTRNACYGNCSLRILMRHFERIFEKILGKGLLIRRGKTWAIACRRFFLNSAILNSGCFLWNLVLNLRPGSGY